MYPLLSKLPRAPASLGKQFQTILLATGHVAAGDAAAATAAFSHIDKALVSKAYELAVVQGAALVGLPRALHAAAALQQAGVVGGAAAAGVAAAEAGEMRADGAAAFARVYGRQAERVRARLGAFHGGLESWVVGCVYGRLLGRALTAGVEISARERELCVVAALCADEVAGVQLASHLRGAVLAGASRDEVGAVVGMAGVLYGPDRAAAARAVWDSYERARYAL